MASRYSISLLTLSILLITLSLLLPQGTTYQNTSKDKGISIVTSLPVIADIVRNVAGDVAVVESLVKPGINVASYDITPKDSIKIAEADVFFYVGYGSEEVLGIYAENIRNKMRVFRLLDFLPDAGPENPYFWLDPLKVEKLSWRIAEILSEVDEENSATYMQNAEIFSDRLIELDKWIRDRISEIPEENRKLVSVRNTMSHFASRYGINVIGYVTAYAGTYEPQARSVVELADKASEENIHVFFVEYEESATTLREVIETVAEAHEIEVVKFLYIESLAPQHGVKTYFDMMRSNTETLVKALKTNPRGEIAATGQQAQFLGNPLLEPFRYGFMQRGFLVLLLVVVAAAFVGSFAVLRGWAIFGDALAHGGVAGLVAAYLLSLDYFVGALAAGLTVALLVSTIEKMTKLRTDVIIALTFTTMFSLAVVMLSYMGGATVSIEDILFADVTAVSQEMMIRTVATTTSVIVFAFLFRKALLIYSVDPVVASAMGFKTTLIHYGLLIILALAIISAFMTIGAIPAIASLIIPPAAAFIISRNPAEFFVKSIAIAVVSAFAGLYISYYLNTNTGAATILVAALVFAGFLLVKRG